MPKRRVVEQRRGRAAAVVPGLLLRLAMRSPKDFLAGLIALSAIGAIVANAMFLQAGRHPSPMFGSPTFAAAPPALVSNPLPRPRPIEVVPPVDKLDARLFDARPAELRPVARPEPRGEPKVEKAEAKEAREKAEPIQVSAPRQAPPARQASASVPRPPAAVPTRSDPLADLISCGSARCR